MAKVDAQVQLDAAVLASIDVTAKRLGRSRDELIEDSVRRDLAGRLFAGISDRRPSDAPELDDEQTAALVYGEVDGARRDRSQSQ